MMMGSSQESPLPPPDELEHYERIVPGAAERILSMAEAEQSHRHAIDTAASNREWDNLGLIRRDNFIGMWLGFAALAMSIAAVLVSVWIGAPWQVSVALIGLPVMIVAAELVRRKR